MANTSSTTFCFFLFSLIRPPPRSPLFPYTTLFRSLPRDDAERAVGGDPAVLARPDRRGPQQREQPRGDRAAAHHRDPRERLGHAREHRRLQPRLVVVLGGRAADAREVRRRPAPRNLLEDRRGAWPRLRPLAERHHDLDAGAALEPGLGDVAEDPAALL